MSRTSNLRRRLGAALLATGLVGGMVLTAAPAEAMISQVCIAWTSHGSGYIDRDGNDIYVIEARCSMWMTTGGEPPDEPGKDPKLPKGPSPDGDETKAEHCEFLKGELAAQRAALAWARDGIQAAEDELDLLTYKSSADHAAYAAALAELKRAQGELENAKAHYQEETDTELEYETRNGNTVVVQLPVNPNRPWGDVVIGAQEQLDRARAAERAAWDKWSRQSDPAARAAQERFNAMQQVLGTVPMQIEALQRDLARDC
ncbi:hypothetical protein BH09ACT12_BH09ACT12_30820 [soil metagenome]